MSWKTTLLGFACASVLLLNACRYTELKLEAPGINTLPLSEKFRITLPEDHSKGETWQFRKDENYQAFEDLGSVWHGAQKGVDFNLKALSPGQYTLEIIKLVYRDSVERKQFIVNITD